MDANRQRSCASLVDVSASPQEGGPFIRADLDGRLYPAPHPSDDPDPVRHHGDFVPCHPVRAGRAGRAGDRPHHRPEQRRRACPAAAAMPARRNFDAGSESSRYRGSQGLDPEFIARLEKQFGFDKPPLERFGKMLWDYARFDFGDSYFRDISVLDLILEKMPVSITHRPVDHADFLSDLHPARHPQGGEGRLHLRYLDQRRGHRRLCHPRLPVRHHADGAVCRRIVLRLVSAARPDLGQFRPALLAAEDPRLSLAHHPAADRDGAVGLRHDDAADQELLPRRNQASNMS